LSWFSWFKHEDRAQDCVGIVSGAKQSVRLLLRPSCTKFRMMSCN
jgi:hypothetical protein